MPRADNRSPESLLIFLNIRGHSAVPDVVRELCVLEESDDDSALGICIRGLEMMLSMSTNVLL